MIQQITISVYRLFYLAAKSLVLIFKSRLSPKWQAWIELRQSSQNFPVLKKRAVWFHAASGEIEYLKSLIRDYKKNQPDTSIVVSYSSPSAPKLFENIKSSVDHFFPMSWDQKKPLQQLLEQIKPSEFFFGRTDLWPELIIQLNRYKVKTYVVSYNPNLDFLNRLWSKFFLSQFHEIFCTHPIQEQILKSILPETVKVSTPGDTRFDQVFWRLQQPSKIPFQIPEPFLVFGSTWPEDEKIFFPLLIKVRELGYRIVCSPHEIDPATIDRLETVIKDQSLTCEKYSSLSSADADVILLDKIGYLADFYRLADGAFIGGSFKSRVHSVMEPLCCAIPVITGPMIANSPEALQYHNIIMNELRVVQVAHTTDEFLAAILKIKNTSKSEFKKLLIGNLEKNRYATRRIMDSLFG